MLYNKPFRFGRILANKELEVTDLGHSISHHIELIIFTRYGEHRHNHHYGCEIWDLDFELVVSTRVWEEKFRQSLLRSITEYEDRLYQVAIDIKLSDVEKLFPGKNISEIKKQVNITVTGKIRVTGENYLFSTALFLSPLSS
jgi:phage baseplate assembly protein W